MLSAFLRIFSIEKLQKLFSNDKFRSAFSKYFDVGKKSASDAASSVAKWIEDNPLKAQVALTAAIAATPSMISELFSPEEITEIARNIQNLDANKPEDKKVLSLLDSKMGDKTEKYYGHDTTDFMSDVDMCAASIARTERIAKILEIRPTEVQELVRLINLVEPQDGEIYLKLARR